MWKCWTIRSPKATTALSRTKLVTFGVKADSLSSARARLETGGGGYLRQLQKAGGQIPPPDRAGTAGALTTASSTPAAPTPFRFSWDMIPQTRPFHKGLYRPRTALTSVSARLFRGGDDLGRGLLFADFGLGAFGQAAGGAFGNGRGNDHHPSISRPSIRPPP